jgi:hypothetical protein
LNFQAFAQVAGFVGCHDSFLFLGCFSFSGISISNATTS